MLIVAATQYVIDQNGPSRPYLLTLGRHWADDTISKERLGLALREHFAEVTANAGELFGTPDGPERPPNADDFVVLREHHYGDLRVLFRYDRNVYLFVSLPDELKDLAIEFPSI